MITSRRVLRGPLPSRWAGGFKEGNDHGPDHIVRVLENVTKLLGDGHESHVTAYELYLTMMSVIYHDVGILRQRKDHADLSAQAVDQIEREVDLSSADKDIIMRAVASHSSSKDIAKVCEDFPDEDFVEGERVRPRVIAALVRLADELDEDERRSRHFIEQYIDIPETSRFFWLFCQRISGIDISSSRLEISFHVRFESGDLDLYPVRARRCPEPPLRGSLLWKMVRSIDERQVVNRFLPRELHYARVRLSSNPFAVISLGRSPGPSIWTTARVLSPCSLRRFLNCSSTRADAAIETREATLLQKYQALGVSLARQRSLYAVLGEIQAQAAHASGRDIALLHPGLRSYQPLIVASQTKPRVVDILARVLSGVELSQSEVRHLVAGIASGEIPDYQITTFLTAVHLKGMTDASVRRLALALVESGEVLDLHGSVPYRHCNSPQATGSATFPISSCHR